MGCLSPQFGEEVRGRYRSFKALFYHGMARMRTMQVDNGVSDKVMTNFLTMDFQPIYLKTLLNYISDN